MTQPVGPAGRTRSRSPRTLSFAVAGLVTMTAGKVLSLPPAPDASPPPNVVVVLIDTLRPDHLGLYGYRKDTSPFLDRLAERSVVFLEASSTSSWTAPSVASLFTGLYPQQHGLTLGFAVTKKASGWSRTSSRRLKPGAATLPELFREAGYATYGIATNVNVRRELGFARGFDRFVLLEESPDTVTERAAIIGKAALRPAPDAEQVDSFLVGWEKEIRSGPPWFLYLHFMDPHKPYHARAPFFEEPADSSDAPVAAYDSEIAYLDRVLERIHARLGLGANDLLVVLSDHGEEFGEHGGQGHPGGLHRELNRIVFFVSAPGLDIAPQVIRERVSIVDVLPTLAGLTPMTAPAAGAGISLAPLLTDPGETEDLRGSLRERVLFAHRIGMPPGLEPTWAAMEGPWRLLRSRRWERLFHIARDPGEQRDVAAENPDVAAALGARLDAFLEAVGPGEEPVVEVPLSEEELETLRSLGYAR